MNSFLVSAILSASLIPPPQSAFFLVSPRAPPILLNGQMPRNVPLKATIFQGKFLNIIAFYLEKEFL